MLANQQTLLKSALDGVDQGNYTLIISKSKNEHDFVSSRAEFSGNPNEIKKTYFLMRPLLSKKLKEQSRPSEKKIEIQIPGYLSPSRWEKLYKNILEPLNEYSDIELIDTTFKVRISEDTLKILVSKLKKNGKKINPKFKIMKGEEEM